VLVDIKKSKGLLPLVHLEGTLSEFVAFVFHFLYLTHFLSRLQFDEWKILSGHKDGSVSLWDRHHGTVYWQTQMKHPVRICCFTDQLLTSVNIPEEKFPRNSSWYADDVMQHRKYRGKGSTIFIDDRLNFNLAN